MDRSHEGSDLENPNRIHLTQDELEKLALPAGVSGFQRLKFEKDAKKNWDLFYKRNGNRFFKHRFWARKEFHELYSVNASKHEASSGSETTKYLLEIGCGCGNFVLPLLGDVGYAEDEDDIEPSEERGNLLPDNLYIYCCDISDKAIEILRENELFATHKRAKAFVANVITDLDKIQTELDSNLMNFVSLIFVLSAMEPVSMNRAVENIHKLMAPNGLVLIRDYAIYDKAMLKFSEDSKICDQFYARQDGTRAYFFSQDQLMALFTSQGLFECKSIDYVQRETLNNATKDRHLRIFLQAKFSCKK